MPCGLTWGTNIPQTQLHVHENLKHSFHIQPEMSSDLPSTCENKWKSQFHQVCLRLPWRLTSWCWTSWCLGDQWPQLTIWQYQGSHTQYMTLLEAPRIDMTGLCWGWLKVGVYWPLFSLALIVPAARPGSGRYVGRLAECWSNVASCPLYVWMSTGRPGCLSTMGILYDTWNTLHWLL